MSTHLSKERSSLCSFSFADGRRCRSPRLPRASKGCPAHPHLCSFHARKEAQALAAQQVGRDISSYLSNSYLSACDLSSALGQVFSAVAQGQLKPKTATTLAYLGQTLAQAIPIAQREYINAFDTNAWREAISASFAPPTPAPRSSALDSEPPSNPLPSSAAEYVEAVCKLANTPRP
jgi:hypothetical protein